MAHAGYDIDGQTCLLCFVMRIFSLKMFLQEGGGVLRNEKPSSISHERKEEDQRKRKDRWMGRREGDCFSLRDCIRTSSRDTGSVSLYFHGDVINLLTVCITICGRTSDAFLFICHLEMGSV